MRYVLKPAALILLAANLVPLIGVLAWGWKILIHLNGVDGWGAQ